MFSAWPSSVQNKIKTVLASYCSKAQNTTCTIWLLGYKYFVHLSGRWLFADKMKNGIMQCNEMTIVTNLFVPLHALLFWLRIQVVDPCFIVNNELWNKFSVSYKKFFLKLCTVLMLAFSTPIWQTLCSYAKMHKIFTAQKSHCACRVLSLATMRSKYYFYFILNRTRSGQELYDRLSIEYDWQQNRHSDGPITNAEY